MKKSDFYYRIVRGMILGALASIACLLVAFVAAFIINAEAADDFIGGLMLVFCFLMIPHSGLIMHFNFKSDDERRKELKEEN